VISTVDPDARHGRKTSARGFDGYEGHVAIDPDSELITATTVTAGNVGDSAATAALLTDDIPDKREPAAVTDTDTDTEFAGDAAVGDALLAVYGDCTYGAGSVLDLLEGADAQIMCEVQPAVAPGGRYSKDAPKIDLRGRTVTCPTGHAAPDPIGPRGGRTARFGHTCTGCPLAERCTTAKTNRTISTSAAPTRRLIRRRAAIRTNGHMM